jgi:hypothetical protein
MNGKTGAWQAALLLNYQGRSFVFAEHLLNNKLLYSREHTTEKGKRASGCPE